MKHVFDSSSIFRAIRENKVEALVGNATLDLARYEMGNILWKNYALKAKAEEKELESLVEVVKQTLNILEIMQITGDEEKVLNVAMELRITFYDASFAYSAKMSEAMLVTEDAELLRKVASYVRASKLDDADGRGA